jgi:hypothetical protein
MSQLPAPLVLPYSREPRPWLTRLQRRLLIIAAALVAAAFVPSPLPPWSTSLLECCSECGTTRTRTATWFGQRVSTVIAPTALHACIIGREGGHAHDWKFMSEWNSTGMRACGRAPAAKTVRAFDDWLTRLPDDEIASLVAALRQPDKRLQEAAVRRAGDIVFSPADRPAIPPR